MTRRRRILWIIAIVIALPLCAVAVAWGFRDRIALAIIRGRLAEVLAVPADVAHIAISPLGDRIAVSGVRIGQHPTDPAIPLVTLDRIDLAWSPWALVDRRIEIEALDIDGVAVRADRLADGRVTVADLLRPGSGSATAPASATAGLAIRVARIGITGIRLELADALAATTPWRVTVDHTNVDIEDFRLDPGQAPTARIRGTVSLRVASPPGFAAGDLLAMPGSSLSAELAPDRIRIAALVALSPSAVLIRHPDGRSNVDDAILRLTAIAAAIAGPSGTSAPRGDGRRFALELAHLRLMDGRAEVHDGVIAHETVAVRVDGIQLGIDEVWLHPAPGAPATAARVRLDARIHQPDPHPTALLAVRGQVAPWNGGIPSVEGAFALTGFAFATVEALVPPAARTAVGAEGFDLAARMTLTPGSLHAVGALVGDRGVSLPFRIGGTATAPVLAGSPLLRGAFNRLGGGAWNLAEGVVGSGIEAVSGGVGAVADLGGGILSAGADVGGGLARIVAGVVTLDGDRIGAGARRATVGAAGSLGDGLVAAGGGVVDAGGSTVGALGGSRVRNPWREAIPQRHGAEVMRADLVLAGATVAISPP